MQWNQRHRPLPTDEVTMCFNKYACFTCIYPAHLGDGVVRWVGRLQTLIARDSNTDVGCLDHPDIIGSITDGQRDDLYLLLDHLHHLWLLQRGNSEGGQAPQGKPFTELKLDFDLPSLNNIWLVQLAVEGVLFFGFSCDPITLIETLLGLFLCATSSQLHMFYWEQLALPRHAAETFGGQCGALWLSRDDVIKRVSVLGCETVNVYVLSGLRGLIHLPVSLSALDVCTQQRQVVVKGGKINRKFDVMYWVRRFAVVLKTPCRLLGPRPHHGFLST